MLTFKLTFGQPESTKTSFDGTFNSGHFTRTMTPPRIPTDADFPADITLTISPPDPPESTSAILILFHGLGHVHGPFAALGRQLSLPGVLSIAVRGPAVVPAALLGDVPGEHYHWGDDLTLSSSTGDLDPDPGFTAAESKVLDGVVRRGLVERCGWRFDDVLLFGFGQGGSLALGLAARLSAPQRVVDVTDGGGEGERGGNKAFKGVVSIGGSLPSSMVSTISNRGKSKTPVLLCHGSQSEALDEDAIEAVRKEFESVKDVSWAKADDSMPKSREEMLPIMRFFAERLRDQPELFGEHILGNRT